MSPACPPPRHSAAAPRARTKPALPSPPPAPAEKSQAKYLLHFDVPPGVSESLRRTRQQCSRAATPAAKSHSIHRFPAPRLNRVDVNQSGPRRISAEKSIAERLSSPARKNQAPEGRHKPKAQSGSPRRSPHHRTKAGNPGYAGQMFPSPGGATQSSCRTLLKSTGDLSQSANLDARAMISLGNFWPNLLLHSAAAPENAWMPHIRRKPPRIFALLLAALFIASRSRRSLALRAPPPRIRPRPHRKASLMRPRANSPAASPRTSRPERAWRSKCTINRA